MKNTTVSATRIFNLLDAGGDGKVSRQEFEKVISVLIAAADEDKSGFVTECEYREKIISIAGDLFDALDVDRDGKLTADEIGKIFDAAAGADKVLDKAEFTTLFTPKPAVAAAAKK